MATLLRDIEITENGTPEPKRIKLRLFSTTYTIHIMKNYKRDG